MKHKMKIIDSEKQDELLQYLEKDRLQITHLVGEEILRKIKIPIQLIRARSETLCKQLNFHQRENAQAILDQVEQIEQMTASFEQLIHEKEYEKTAFSPYQLCEDVVLFFQYRMSAAKIEVVNAIDPELELNESQGHLRQILMSLFINAIEALEETTGGNKTIFFHFHSDKKMHHISIEDNGPGIQPGLIKSVFQPFASTKKNHVGLSLAICKKMSQTLGWQLEISSRGQKGTCVEIGIPHSSGSTSP